jgi:predicted nucleic acid-binding protein
MKQAPPIAAFLDASVLYPALLRNILMRLASHGLFRARWSQRVHEEWIEALLRNRPDLDRARVERTRDLMDAHILDACVSGYELRIDSLVLPDPDDRHVLAAAIHCKAAVIVTTNLRDFPGSVLAGFGLKAMHADMFVLGVVLNDKEGAAVALQRLRQAFRNPPMTAAELLAGMERNGLAASASALSAIVDAL